MQHLEAHSGVDELPDRLHTAIRYGTWKCSSDDYKETVSLKDKKYTFLMQRDVGALRQYMYLVQQTLSMKKSVVEEILFNTAHPHKTTHSLEGFCAQPDPAPVRLPTPVWPGGW